MTSSLACFLNHLFSSFVIPERLTDVTEVVVFAMSTFVPDTLEVYLFASFFVDISVVASYTVVNYLFRLCFEFHCLRPNVTSENHLIESLGFSV